jgi:alkylhydroperoxidase family enzyme
MNPDDRSDEEHLHSPEERSTLRAMRRAVDDDRASARSPALKRLREIGLSQEEIVSVLMFLAETEEI